MYIYIYTQIKINFHEKKRERGKLLSPSDLAQRLTTPSSFLAKKKGERENKTE